ncbi:MAG TPA: GNAT family N-acetyltransferase [Burkholderiaceae bacterium]|nr:GNAT family N-acetyltransferase [Burkholderiaceae bacterium]
MPVLRPISENEYAAWLATVIPEYAADKVATGQWAAETSLELSREAFEDLLPQGPRTADNRLYTILSAEGAPVGTLWIAIQARGTQRVAYVYDVVIGREHRRRGHAERAFKALEQEAAGLGLSGIALHVFGHNHGAQALYAKLGFVATNINLFKPLVHQGT